MKKEMKKRGSLSRSFQRFLLQIFTFNAKRGGLVSFENAVVN